METAQNRLRTVQPRTESIVALLQAKMNKRKVVKFVRDLKVGGDDVSSIFDNLVVPDHTRGTVKRSLDNNPKTSAFKRNFLSTEVGNK